MQQKKRQLLYWPFTDFFFFFKKGQFIGFLASTHVTPHHTVMMFKSQSQIFMTSHDADYCNMLDVGIFFLASISQVASTKVTLRKWLWSGPESVPLFKLVCSIQVLSCSWVNSTLLHKLPQLYMLLTPPTLPHLRALFILRVLNFKNVTYSHGWVPIPIEAFELN